MPLARHAAVNSLTVLATFGLGACALNPAPATNAPTSSQTTSAASTSTASSTIQTTSPDQENQMRIEITIGDQHLQATLDDSAASRDLHAQLPVTLQMQDHGSVEKTGRLPSPLSLDGQPDGADPDVGDVGYYAPGNDLVLYYGDQSYYPGIVILGQMDGNAAQRLTALDGSVTATVTTLTQ